jgi:hypothetical protein
LQPVHLHGCERRAEPSIIRIPDHLRSVGETNGAGGAWIPLLVVSPHHTSWGGGLEPGQIFGDEIDTQHAGWQWSRHVADNHSTLCGFDVRRQRHARIITIDESAGLVE